MAELLPWVVGWLVGWLLLSNPRPLPTAGDGDRPPISVIVPARNEAGSIGTLVAALVDQAGDDDEVIVVDDGSDDATAELARAAGALVVEAAPPPDGWLGKPHACLTGRRLARNDLLVFVDADVRPGAGFCDAIAAAADANAGGLTSVQPWHVPGSPAEQLSMFCNVAALTATGAFTPWGRRVRPELAFGPVLAVHADRYDAVGGHGHPSVRVRITEDIGLARTVGSVRLFTGRPSVAFRMYPGGLPDLVRGWTRSLAAGAGAADRFATLLTVGWIWSLAAAPFVAWWLYPLAAVQVGIVARRAGRFSPWSAAVYPLALAVFVLVLVRSAWRVSRGATVPWKGRQVDAS